MRRADAAITVSRLFHEITQTFSRNEPYRSAPTKTALELIAIMTFIVTVTRDGNPPTQRGITEEVGIKRSTVLRRLKTLIDNGRVRRVDHVYMADLDRYDEIVTPEMIEEWFRLISNAAQALRSVRAIHKR